MTLIERLEQATGPDREIDGEICLTFGWTFQKLKGDRKPYFRRPGDTEFFMRSEPPRYTASLDEALALVEERAKAGDIHHTASDMLREAIDDMHTSGWRPNQPEGPQIARRLLIALLKALGDQHD